MVGESAAIYKNGAFAEFGHVMTTDTGVKNDQFELRGRQLKLPDKAVERYETAHIYCIKWNSAYL